MRFFENRNNYRWLLIAISFIIISSILWNTFVFTQHFKEEERIKMNIWSLAQSEINENRLGDNLGDLALEVATSNETTPMIIVNKYGEYNLNNIPKIKDSDSLKIKKLIDQFKSENDPIELTFINENNETESAGTLYYGNSELINKLKYYPLALLLIIFLFGTIIFLFYKSSRVSAQNKLWAGMAKETAHQIGTPLSSMVGWVELLKMENVGESTISEIEKDITRLQTITDRFSKIGSVPNLERHNIVEQTKNSFDYLEARLSKYINFTFESSESEIYVNLNAQLYSWTIENLVKNAIDAMKGRGDLSVKIDLLEETVKIDVIDTGKGISKKNYKKVFDPGYTSKKRGWGLGLSLAKRIIEDYHDGRIKVQKSELDKGTTMRISLKTTV